MAAPTAEQLAAVEARLRAILVPYESKLVAGSVYNLPTLTRPGAKKHDWFAFVKPGPKHVSFFLLPIHTWPDLLEGLSSALAKRVTGASCLTFAAIDDAQATELEGLVARAYERYAAAG